MRSRYKVKRRKKNRILKPLIALTAILALLVIAVGTYSLHPTPSESHLVNSSSSTSSSIGSKPTSSFALATPTPIPVADLTPPPPVNLDDLKMSWETPAVFDGENAFAEQKMTMTGQDGGMIDYWIVKNGQAISQYQTNAPISFGDPENYTNVEGVLTFRGNNYRDSPAWGLAEISQKKLEIVWTKDIGAVSTKESYWPGSGWTGQPLLVHWPESTRMAMNISSEMKQKDLVEVIYPVFDGNIYFPDLETGM